MRLRSKLQQAGLGVHSFLTISSTPRESCEKVRIVQMKILRFRGPRLVSGEASSSELGVQGLVPLFRAQANLFMSMNYMRRDEEL